MPDFTAHIRLRDCCRSKLRDIDQARGHLAGKPPSLEAMLGQLPVDQAIEKAPTVLAGGAAAGPHLARVNKACIKVCDDHVQCHEDEGARTEAGFWKLLGTLFRGDDISQVMQSLQPAPAPQAETCPSP